MTKTHLPRMIETEAGLAPEAPGSVEATGIERSMLLDLALRTAHVSANLTTDSAAQQLHLPRVIADSLLEQLRADLLLEVLSKEGPFGYRYAISQRGRERAQRLMEVSGYVGPAP